MPKYFAKTSSLFSARVFIAALSILVYSVAFTHTADAKSRGKVISGKYAAYVIDARTGHALHQYNADTKRHPASLTKMMTLVMLFDALERRELTMNSNIRISHHAASMVPSKIGLAPGETIKVKDAINALAVKSANDIAVAVAEQLAGSEWQFARLMTMKAHQLGMDRTNFVNASGLHHPKQVSTARDMARLAQVVATSYPNYYHIFSQKSFTYRGTTYRSHNRLLDSYAGMDGLKTGYIAASGFNLASSVRRDEQHIIAVVLGGATSRDRNARMAYLLDNAFEKMNNSRLLASYKAPIPQRKPTTDDVTEIAYLPKISTGNYGAQGRWKMLESDEQSSMFNRMIGQGDYDITVRNRIETGLIAISAHTKSPIPNYILANDNRPEHIRVAAPKINEPAVSKQSALNIPATGNWSIQIGAFSSRNATDKVISDTLKKLPTTLRHGQAEVAPVSTRHGWIYRARLRGYSMDAAKDACKMLPDCITLAPRT